MCAYVCVCVYVSICLSVNCDVCHVNDARRLHVDPIVPRCGQFDARSVTEVQTATSPVDLRRAGVFCRTLCIFLPALPIGQGLSEYGSALVGAISTQPRDCSYRLWQDTADVYEYALVLAG